MASKSPAELKSEGEELKTLFAKIKKKQHNCAVLISKEGIVFEAHIKKSPDMMFKAAKAAGGAPKGAWGTITMDGQVLILDPINDKVPGNLTKVAKKFFGERGLKNRLEIKEPDEGAAPTEATEETEEQPTGGGNAAQVEEEESAQASTAPTEDGGSSGGPRTDPLQAAKDKYKSLEKDIAELNADKENVMYDGLQEVLKNYDWIIEEGDADKATEVVGRLEGVLEDYARLMSEKKPLVKRYEKMARDLENLKSGDHADAVGAQIRGYDYALANNEWGEAGRKLDALEALIEETGGSASQPSEEAEQSAPTTDEAPSSDSQQAPEEPQTRASEDTAEDSSAPSDKSDAQADPLQAVKDRFKARENDINALTNDTENVMHSSLMDALKAHERMLEAGDPGNASDTMARIEGVLADYESLMAEKRPLVERFTNMARGIDGVKSGENSGAADTLAAMIRAYEYSVNNNEWVSAGLKLDEMQALVDEHGGSSTQTDEEEEEIQASESSSNEESPPTSNQEEDEDLSNVESNSDQLRRENMKNQIDGNKKAINAILKNKDSENAQALTAALQVYANGLKRDNLDGAQAALDDVDEVLAKAEREFSLTDQQRGAILKELEKMEKEIADLTSELAS